MRPPRRSSALLALPAILALAAGASAQTADAADAADANAPSKSDAAGSFAIVAGKKVSIPSIPMGDPATIARIIDEGKNRNQVMDHLQHLCLQIGPRLTGSSRLEAANRWTRDQFQSWGLANARLEEWGQIATRFDRGPSTGKILLATTRPQRPGRNADGEEADGEPEPETTYRDMREIEFSTLAWMAGTSGPVRGPIIRMPQTEQEYEDVKDKLEGAWILVPRIPEGVRMGVADRRRGFMGIRHQQRLEAREKVAAGEDASTLPVETRILFDGINGFLSASRDDRVWTSSVPGWREREAADIPPDVEITIRLSDYDFINSRLVDGDPIVAEFDLKHEFTPGPIPVYNTIAEIKGSVWPDEYVIVSAHLDSWDGPGSQGTTDNGTGSSVTLEAARILMAAGAKPKRTIKFILWTGEEQGLLGSRAYVEADKDRLARISAVFVDDGGTNYEGGLRCTDDMVPMLAAATAPINNVFYCDVDGEFLNVNVRPQATLTGRAGGGSSDHASFIRAGVPGFFWDEVGRADYGYGWHTQNDRIDLAIPIYLQQSATCAALTAYNIACAPTLLPREQPREEEDERPAGRRRPAGEGAASSAAGDSESR